MDITASETVETVAGIVYKRETWVAGDGPPTRVTACYGEKDGGFVGDWDDGRTLNRLGIVPEARPGKTVCTIGFCERDAKWYGWSHRARYGFGVGDAVEEGSCCVGAPEDPRGLPVGFVAFSLEDARRMAEAFAEGVN